MSILAPRAATLQPRQALRVRVGSGIHPASNGEIRAGNVRGLRTGDERHQRGDLINMPIAVERCGGLLRSEEHTSELQSQSNLVCRLLLEKKKKNITLHRHHISTAYRYVRILHAHHLYSL